MNVRASIPLLVPASLSLSLALLACSSGGGGGASSYGDAGANASRSSGSTTPGTNGSSRPAGATSVTCSKSSDCGNWVCECNDGPVNATNCTNGYCLDAEHTCPKACSDYHATWTGTASGGPTTARSSSSNSSPSPSPSGSSSSSGTASAGSCTLHTDCPKMICTCTSGFTTSDLEVQSCDSSTHQCRDKADACPDACGEDGLQWIGK